MPSVGGLPCWLTRWRRSRSPPLVFAYSYGAEALRCLVRLCAACGNLADDFGFGDEAILHASFFSAMCTGHAHAVAQGTMVGREEKGNNI